MRAGLRNRKFNYHGLTEREREGGGGREEREGGRKGASTIANQLKNLNSVRICSDPPTHPSNTNRNASGIVCYQYTGATFIL